MHIWDAITIPVLLGLAFVVALVLLILFVCNYDKVNDYDVDDDEFYF